MGGAAAAAAAASLALSAQNGHSVCEGGTSRPHVGHIQLNIVLFKFRLLIPLYTNPSGAAALGNVLQRFYWHSSSFIAAE
jgi:hypothetical protein